MDIKTLLNNEIEAANEAKHEKAKQDSSRDEEAARIFEPVASAVERLKSELSPYPEIKFWISSHLVSVRLGEDKLLESHRYGWSKKFVVEETNTYRFPEYDVLELKREFDDGELQSPTWLKDVQNTS